MEPRHYRMLAIVLLVLGAILSGLGLVFIYALQMNMAGAIMLVFGCAMALISLPTFMILMLLTQVTDSKK
jgi:hypothetical protein